MTNKKLVILVAACNEAGHLNATAGSMLPLKQRGHRVIFVLPESWRGKLVAVGFEEYVYAEAKPPTPDQHPGEHNAKVMLQSKLLGPYSPMEKLEELVGFFESDHHKEEIIGTDAAVKEAIELYKPDLAVVDAHSLSPSLFYSGIPWIRSCSMNPLFDMFHDELPPGGSGLSQSGDRCQWKEFNQLRHKAYYSKGFSELLRKLGYEPYVDDAKFPPTQLLTIYACPEELNYTELRESRWFNLEAFNKFDVSQQESKLEDLLPASFLSDTLDGKWSGKYIYVGLGSMASADVTLMSRIIGALEQTCHKYIVSKGPRGDAFELPRNMYGANYLPQAKLIPLMDLVVTHAGNNTFTETFARGKPMVVMPIFADQFDNANRLSETGLGIRLDPYQFEGEQLRSAIDKLLADHKLSERLQAVAKRIQASNRHQELADKIEELLAK